METMETGEVHAHGVMWMMKMSGKRYSRAGLAAEIGETFGEGTRFRTCCAFGLTAEELIDFLWEKGKLQGTEDDFVFTSGDACEKD